MSSFSSKVVNNAPLNPEDWIQFVARSLDNFWLKFEISNAIQKNNNRLMGKWHSIHIIYLSGMNLELWVDPIPGRPCDTGLYEIDNSPR